ncbi:MAG: hypothetical protein II863_02055 [Kiritimatiellae bacterium]|nr:hypothetical protein [Kiritimatiellia bacterium]
MKRLIAMAIVAVAAIEFVSAAPEVTDITAKQRYPWNGLVDITCKVSGIEADAGGYEFAVVAVNKETGREYAVSTFSIQHNGEEVPDVCDNGDYSLVWNAREDMGQAVVERMTVRITLEALAVSVGKVQLWEGGPYWADRNIGAKKPEDSGLYFWWGDRKGHRPTGTTFSFPFTSWNCPTYKKTTDQLRSEGWITSTGILAPSHDAAHVKWGGSWRMPTMQELTDLFRKCDWTWTTMNGASGHVFRGKGDYASKSIFLPAAGRGGGASLCDSGTYGYYWSSVPDSNYEPLYKAWTFAFRQKFTGSCNYSRDFWQSVRPVQ